MTERLHTIICDALSDGLKRRTADEIEDFISIVAEKKIDVLDAEYYLNQEEGLLLLPPLKGEEERADKKARQIWLHNAASAMLDLHYVLSEVSIALENELALRRESKESRG